MDKIHTHYDNLQVAENASPEVIKGAYRFLAQKWHPDRNPSEREKSEKVTKLINQAYSVLSDPIRRKEHDEWIKSERSKAQEAVAQPAAQPESNNPEPTTLLKLAVITAAAAFGISLGGS